jgi:signal transduction histidine kinase
MPFLTIKRVLPVISFVVFGSMAVALWQNQNSHDREMVLRHAQTSAEQFCVRIEGLMSARIASLKLIADRWVEREPSDFSEQRFYGFAEILFRHYQGFAGIDWIDDAGVFRWVFPKEDSASLKGKNLAREADPRCQAALIQARESRKTAMSLSAEHTGGVMGFHVIVPLLVDEQIHGFLEGFFLVPQIVEMSMPGGIREDFIISLFEDGRLIYGSAATVESDQEVIPITAKQEIQFSDRRWQVVLEPSAGYYAYASSWHLEVLAFGLALSAALSLLLYALLRRMLLYRETRDQALREVTERKRVEAMLRVNEQKLETLLAELSAKNAEMESFVYTVSHDLKTPIVTIEGFIGALREDFADRLSESGEQYIRYMSEAARKMEALINDLLNLSRIGRLTESKIEFPFHELVQEVVESLQPRLESRGIDVYVEPNLPVVYGERKRISQVIDNLLNNAVKYIGRDNPSPRIEVGCEEHDGQKVFFVRDNGIGIESKYFDKIFQIFERLPAAKQAGEGTGIGLTIVKRIIEVHDGKVWVASELGKGTTFFFTFGDKDT